MTYAILASILFMLRVGPIIYVVAAQKYNNALNQIDSMAIDARGIKKDNFRYHAPKTLHPEVRGPPTSARSPAYQKSD
jgi:hypothetical protein